MKENIKSLHPKETPRTLFHHSIRGKSKAHTKIGAANLRKHRNIRKKHPTHDVVAITPPEKNDKGMRGSLFFCKKCFCALPRGTESRKLLTCAQKRRYMKQNHKAAAKRRTWWMRLKKDEPLFARNVASGFENSFKELDELFNVHVVTGSAARWQKQKQAAAAASME